MMLLALHNLHGKIANHTNQTHQDIYVVLLYV